MNKNQLHFHLSHVILGLSVIALALAMRSVAINAKSEMVTSVTAIAISPITTLMMQFLGSNKKSSVAAGVLASAVVLAIHIIDCLLQTPATEYAWRYISGDIFLIVVPVYLAGSFVASTVTALLAGFVIRLLNEQR